MKKIVMILFALALIVGSCGQATKQQSKPDNTESIVDFESKENPIQMRENHLIRENGVDIFLIGKQVPFNAESYTIKKEFIQFEEGIEEPIYDVFKSEQKVFRIRPDYDYDTEQHTDKIFAITIFSSEFKTAEGIGVGSNIEDFVKTYPHFKVWYSYIGGQYWIEAEQHKSIRFILDEKDYLKEIEFDSDLTEIQLSDFKNQSKIIGIGI